jgi:hypothetical protein
MAEAAASTAVEEDFTVAAASAEAARLAADHQEHRIAPPLRLALRLPRLVTRGVAPTHGPGEIPIVQLQEIQDRLTRAVDAVPV